MILAYSRRNGELVANTTAGGFQGRSAIAELPTGGFVLAWSNGSGGAVRAQRFDAGGAKVGSEIQISASVFGSYKFSEISVTGLDNGAFIVGWQTDSESEEPDNFGAVGRLVDASGVPVGGEFTFSAATAGSQSYPDVTRISGGGFLATWSESDGAGLGIKAQLFDAQGVRVNGVIAVNTSLPSNQILSSVAADSAGGFIVTWQDSVGTFDHSGTAIRVQRFDASGAKVGNEILVTELSNVVRPDVTFLVGGGFVVAWQEQPAGEIFGDVDVKAQVYDAAGQAVGGKFLVNTATVNGQSHAAIAALPWGGFIVTWTDYSQQSGDTSGSAVLAQVFNATGAKVGTEFLVNMVTAGGQIYSDVTVLASGSIVFGWTDYSSANIKAQIFDVASAPTDISLSHDMINEAAIEGIAVADVSSDAAASTSPIYTLIDDSSGGAFAIEGNRLILADNAKLDFETAPTVSVTIRVSDANGNSYDETLALTIADTRDEVRYDAGPEFLVNSIVQGLQIIPSATAYAGGFVLTWSSSAGPFSPASVRGQLHAADGTRIGGEFAVASNPNNQFAVDAASLASGGFTVAWAESSSSGSYAIKLQVFDPAGVKVGGESLVSQLTPGRHEDPSIAAMAGGGFLVSWTDLSTPNSDVKARLFNALGQPVAAEFLVHSPSSFNQLESSASGLAGGGFVITWHDEASVGSDGGGGSVRAQIFDAAGNKVGGALLVPTDTGGKQSHAAVAALPSGGFVVTWNDHGGFSYPNDSDVKAQLFDAAGNRIGTEFLVTGSSAGAQFQPEVAALSWGGFAIGWSDSNLFGDASFFGVGVQIFDSTGVKIGEPALMNVRTLREQSMLTLAALADGSLVIGWADASGDGSSVTDVRARVLALPDRPAVARADMFETEEALTIVGSVFADNGRGGDSDPDGPALSVLAVNGSAAGVGQSIELPSGATLRLNPDGSFTYETNGVFTALADRFSGATNIRAEDSFTYTLRDGTTATVSFIVHGDYSQNDMLIGSAGNDVLIGSAFDETFVGLAGNDVFFIDNAGDTIVEAANGGTDEMRTALADATIAANVEILTGTSGAGQTLRGDDAANRINGGGGNDAILAGGGNDLLDGGAGADVMTGGLGNDIFVVDDAGDQVIEAAGEGTDEIRTFFATYSLAGLASVENLTGGAAAQTLTGNDAANVIDGGAGADAMAGGLGDDTYVVDQAGDVVTELAGEGTDTVRSGLGSTTDYSMLYVLPDHVENFVGTAAAGQGVHGNAGHNVFTLGAGNDLIVMDGGGIDSVAAGGGNDYLYYGGALTALDQNDGGAGFDTIGLLGVYELTLEAGTLTGIEKLVMYSSGDAALPNSYAITTLDANVAAGQILQVVALGLKAGETLTFFGHAETDGGFAIQSGAGHDILVGGRRNDSISGGAGNDLIYALNGDDQVQGGAGDDQIYGGGGNDRLSGGAGRDLLNGGFGDDVFVYAAASDSTGTGHDVIHVFDARIDRIDLATDAAWNGSVGTGTLSEATFDADLAAAVDGLMQANGAVLFTPDAGDRAGRSFAVIDANGDGAYSAGADYVIEFADPLVPLTGTDIFI